MRYRYRNLLYPGGLRKAVTFSYDDGTIHDARLADTFTKYGVKGTFNLNSRELRAGSAFTDEMIREHILDKGHEVAVHGYMHSAAGKLRPIECIREYLDSRLELEGRFDMIIRGMAYPDSGVNTFSGDINYAEVKHILTDIDIAYARTTGSKEENFDLPTDWHAWSPNARHRHPRLMELIDKFLNVDYSKLYISSHQPRLFYIWGHSYEFNGDNSWDIIERACERFAEARDQIWFATKFEIYDYVMAYRSLVYSADGMTVYNPTLKTIWFSCDRDVYTIAPGETLKIKEQPGA